MGERCAACHAYGGHTPACPVAAREDRAQRHSGEPETPQTEAEIRVGEWRFVRTHGWLSGGEAFPVTLAYDPADRYHVPMPGCRAVDMLFDALIEREAALDCRTAIEDALDAAITRHPFVEYSTTSNLTCRVCHGYKESERHGV